MCNENLLRRAIEHQNIGCDGTFNAVSSNPTDSLSYELNTVACKDKQLGCAVPIFRKSPMKKGRKIEYI